MASIPQFVEAGNESAVVLGITKEYVWFFCNGLYFRKMRLALPK